MASETRTLPIGGRGSCVPVSAAPLGRGASTVVPVARDGRPVPDSGRGGPPAAFAREDGRDGLRTALRAVADGRRPFPGARRLDRVGHPTARVGEASGDPEGARRERWSSAGSVPDSLDELLDLPGVGRYAASATLAVAFEQRAPVVDGVSARVYRRYFGLEAAEPAASDGQLWELVSRGHPAPTDPGVELGGARSGRVGVSPEGSAVRRVPAPVALCLVTGRRLIESDGPCYSRDRITRV